MYNSYDRLMNLYKEKISAETIRQSNLFPACLFKKKCQSFIILSNFINNSKIILDGFYHPMGKN